MLVRVPAIPVAAYLHSGFTGLKAFSLAERYGLGIPLVFLHPQPPEFSWG